MGCSEVVSGDICMLKILLIPVQELAKYGHYTSEMGSCDSGTSCPIFVECDTMTYL